ncbi:MAG: sialate O-acetylesterase [Chitinophagaceae bacterium]
MNRSYRLNILLALSFLPLVSAAQLKLPALVSDSMVLQRDRPVKIWGWSLSGSPVKISFQQKTYQAKPGAGQRWELTLPAMKAGGSYTMEIETGSDKKTIRGIAIGDVWLCSGQSNMAFNMDWAANMFPNDIAQSVNPDIREFHVAQKTAFSTKNDVEGRWAPASPANTGAFTAAGYYMVKDLYERYKVPMGILHTSWGGSSAEAWTSEEGLKDFNNYLTKLKRFTDTVQLNALLAGEKAVIDNWHKQVDENDQGLNKWSDPNYDASSWKTLQFPGYWETQGIPEVDGAVWVRKEIDLTKEMITQDARLELGIIDDIDQTFFNGQKVGSRINKYNLRNYKIPASLMKEGKNVIVIRIVDTDGTGGFIPAKKYRLITGKGEVPLSGTWQYQVGYVSKALPVGSFVVMNQQPTALYNAMIAPLIGYTIKGAAWYQGETNVGRATEYQRLLPSMITDWRSRWQQGDFPFLIVQLANYKQVKIQPEESLWAELRESQDLISQKVPYAGLAVAIDIGEAGDVHPLDKKTVGKRLALAARKLAYGEKDVVYSGPVYQSMKTDQNRIILSFTNTGGGLVVKNGMELKQFSIAGADKKFVWANARIDGDKIIVWSDSVAMPVAVRYAWADNPDTADLYNKEGLPASPFRTDR